MAQLSGDLLLRLIDQIYEASVDPGRWDRFLGSVAEIFDGRAALFRQDLRKGDCSLAEHSRFEASFLGSYIDHYGLTSPWLSTLDRLPAGSVVRCEALAPRDSFEASEFYNDWLRPQGLYAGVGAILEKNRSVATNIAINTFEHRGVCAEEEIALFAKLVPHLQRAMRIHHELFSVRLQRDGALEALDRLATGVIIVADDRRILFCNDVANRILESGQGLLVGSGRLRCETSGMTDRLEHAIREAARTSVANGDHAGDVLRLTCASGQALGVLVSPFRIEGTALALPCSTAILFVSDPCQPRGVPQENLSRLLGLSPAEGRLVCALLDGTRLSDYADAAGISLNTAKTQLKQVFAKAGVNRQSDLIRRVMDDSVLRMARPN